MTVEQLLPQIAEIQVLHSVCGTVVLELVSQTLCLPYKQVWCLEKVERFEALQVYRVITLPKQMEDTLFSQPQCLMRPQLTKKMFSTDD